MSLLTPAAIVIGAVIIAGAIVFVWDDDNDEPDDAATIPGESTPGSTDEEFPPGDSPATMLAALQSYADDVDIDVNEFEQCLGDEQLGAPISQHLQQGQELGVTGTPTFFINDKKLVGAQPFPILEEIVERELEGPPDSVEDYSEPIQELAATDPPNFEITGETIDVSGAEIEGNPDAEVMIAEFSDFQCPFCQRWARESLGPVRDMVGDDVALAFMHYPLTQIHPNAGFASFAAICAGEQDRFWEMHDLLFERQQEWADLPPN